MNNSPSNLRNRIEEVSHETNRRLNRLEEACKWEEVPDEDLWQDGEIGAKEVSEIIFQRVINTGEWKLMRRKDESSS